MSPQKDKPLERRLLLGPYLEIYKELSEWNRDDYIRLLEKMKKKGWGKVLPFVRGLRLSARLIYVIRVYLKGTTLAADWGHLIDKKGEYLSPECDIIIYKKSDGVVREWNDSTKNAVMNFKFVRESNAEMVISCKSFIESNKIEREYCQELLKYVNKVWLFAECCGPLSADKILTKAEEAGYERFFHLYTWSKKKGTKANEEGWLEFVTEIRTLAQSIT